MNKYLLTACAALLLLSCQNQNKPKKYIALSPDEMDLTTDPGVDFYQYANGGWLKKNPCPETESRWTNFSLLQELNKERVNAILNDAVTESSSNINVDMRKIGVFYKTAMDSAAIEKIGNRPLLEEFKKNRRTYRSCEHSGGDSAFPSTRCESAVFNLCCTGF